MDTFVCANKDNLTREMRHALTALSTIKGGWYSVCPRSNMLPLCELKTKIGTVSGEDCDALERLGLLIARSRVDKGEYILGGGDYGPYGHIPAFELNFVWSLSPAGRDALAETPEA